MTKTELSAEQVRHAVVQRLEDLKRAGLTHWKRIAPQSPLRELAGSSVQQVTSVGTGSTGIDVRPAVSVTVSLSHSVTNVNQPCDSVSSTVAKKKTIVAQTSVVPCKPFEPLDLPLDQRIAGLTVLADRVKQCNRCHELATTRTQTVFGVGNPQARILFVGEAPGADEDAQGEPFVGKSGQLLNDIIKACRIQREDLYICNVLRCRPPGNRLPAPDEAANCREYLDGQIAHVNPEYIVCWGACAAQNLLLMSEPIGKLRGRFYRYGRAKVLCTYHPSYLMRNPAAKKDVWEDMKRLFLDMGVDLTKKP